MFAITDAQKVTLTAQFLDGAGQVVTDGVTSWVSSDTSIVNLTNTDPADPTGRQVVAVSGVPGTAVATATLGTVSVPFEIQVTTGDPATGTITPGVPEPK
jgi:hypothetical protein